MEVRELLSLYVHISILCAVVLLEFFFFKQYYHIRIIKKNIFARVGIATGTNTTDQIETVEKLSNGNDGLLRTRESLRTGMLPSDTV